MNIALDATYSLADNLSGVGVYSREILEGLAACHTEARFRWCYRPHRFFKSYRVRLPVNCRRGLLTDQWIPGSHDLFHGLNQRLPRRRFQRTVCTFHDLFVLTGDYSTPEFRRRFAEQARQAAGEADHIITVSRFTAGQVIELLGADPDRVHVVHHGIRSLPAPRREREKVVLSVGAIQKRKNIARLVEAFEAVGEGWELVLVGSAGFGAREILARVENSPARARIRVTGYLPPKSLADWYARAMVFAFPSLDEGFGMPVLEAMSHGIPVVSSNRSAIPEVAGDAALLVDPADTGALIEALRSLICNAGLRDDLAARGRRRAAGFTWREAVAKTWGVYRILLA